MENMNTNPSNSKMWTVVAVAVFAAVILAGWLWWAKPATAPETETRLSEIDTTSELDMELQATDLGDLEAELQTTDADLNAL